MAKLNEAPGDTGFITRFILKVFDSIVKQRNQALKRAAEKDPKFQKAISNLEKSKNELQDWVDDQMKKDPKFKDAYDALGK